VLRTGPRQRLVAMRYIACCNRKRASGCEAAPTVIANYDRTAGCDVLYIEIYNPDESVLSQSVSWVDTLVI